MHERCEAVALLPGREGQEKANTLPLRASRLVRGRHLIEVARAVCAHAGEDSAAPRRGARAASRGAPAVSDATTCHSGKEGDSH